MAAIIGNQNPKVGETNFYEISIFSSLPFFNPGSKYEWYLFKKQKNGNWIDITKNGIPKTGNKVDYTFFEPVAGDLFEIRIFEVKQALPPSTQSTKTLYGKLQVRPTASKIGQIDKVVLFNRGKKDVNKADYRDTLIAQAFCTGLFGQEIEFQLWEDDAAGEGHNPEINKNNKIPRVYKAIVNEKGIAETKISLSADEKIMRQIANKYLMKGDKDEGANHEYYVTATHLGKGEKASQVNVNVANPDYKPKPKENTAKFPATPASTTTKQPDAKGKIIDAYFVDESGKKVSKIVLNDSVKVRISSQNMKGKKVQYVIWEYDSTGHDEILRKTIVISHDVGDSPLIKIDTNTFGKGYSTDASVFGTPLDSDSVKQNYFIEVIPLDVSTESKKFGVDSDGLMEVEKLKSPAVVKKTNQPKKNGCICQQYNLVWGGHSNVSCEFRKKVIDVSKRQNFDPNHLMAVMKVESAGTFSPSKIELITTGYRKNGKPIREYKALSKDEILKKDENFSGAVGLIQFTPIAIKELNKAYGYKLTKRKLALMSQLEQLHYVEKYIEFWKKANSITGKLTLADLYLVVFAPGKMNGSDDNTTLYAEGSEYYDANSSVDTDHKNGITKKEIAARAYSSLAEGAIERETKFECGSSKEKVATGKSSNKWHDPVDNPRLTKYNYYGNVKPSSGTYGYCRRNKDNSKKYHSGFDFFAIPGKDKVYSCLKGNIHQVKYSANAGWIVRIKIQNIKDLLEQEKNVNYQIQFKDELKGIDIKETDNVYFIYMHLHSVAVTEQDAKNKKEIDAGTLLGFAGVSGSIASGGRAPHLHLEIATVLDAFGHGESVRTNPARFVKLNSYDTKDQDQEAKKNHIYKK